MKSPKLPTPPDPIKTAQGQSGVNRDTAVAQQLVNMTDQITPDGALSYAQNGFNTYTDAFGKKVNLPKFTATQTLSQQGQQLHDINAQSDINLATLSRDQSAKLNGLLDRPVDLSNDEMESRLMELGTKRLAPQWARDEDALRTRLINSGIRQGSDAWNTEMAQQGQNVNDARNSLLLAGHGTAVQDTLTARNQPLNEITALMSGSQVNQPNYVGTPQASVGGTDYAAMVQNQYNGNMQAAQMKNSNNQALMGGLFGLAGSATKMIKPF